VCQKNGDSYFCISMVVSLEVIPKGKRTMAWYKNDARVLFCKHPLTCTLKRKLFEDLRGAESAWLDVLEGVVQGTENPNFESWHRLLVRASIFFAESSWGCDVM